MKKIRFSKDRQACSGAYKKAVKELDAEFEKWSKLNFGALCITLKRDYGYGIKRLCDVLEEVLNACDECGNYGTQKSILEMLEEETGISLECGDGKNWRDLPYLNGKLWDGKIPSEPHLIAIRHAQKKWCKATINAGILMAMHRLYGFGYQRLCELYQNMENVLDQYGSIQEIVDVCREETGINIVRYFGEGVKDRSKRDLEGVKE